MASVFLGLDDLKNTLSDALTVRWLRFDKERNHVKIQPNSVVDQAGDCLKDGGQDAEHNGAGNVRAAKLMSEGNEIQMWTDLLGQAWYVKTRTG